MDQRQVPTREAPTHEDVMAALQRVQDPEVRVSILALNMLDEIDIAGGHVTVRFHLTTPFCPAEFATAIAEDIKSEVAQLPGVEGVEVDLLRHYSSGLINHRVNGLGASSFLNSEKAVNLPGQGKDAAAPADSPLSVRISNRVSDGPGVGSEGSITPGDPEGSALEDCASVRRLARRLDMATQVIGYEGRQFRIRWAVQGLQRFMDTMGISDPDGHIIAYKMGLADPEDQLARFWDLLRGKGYTPSSTAGICLGPKLWLRANGVHVDHRPLQGGLQEDATPLRFSQMAPHIRFSLLALLSTNLDISELVALRSSDFGQWDGKRDILPGPDFTADPLAVRVRAEASADGRQRITFLSYDAQRALLLYLEEASRNHTPVLADALDESGEGGLLSQGEMDRIRRIFSKLIETANEANVFLCRATAEVMARPR
jgi:metal-sulfur cluster biosynthetic enzyme